jgi:hypothetical protein
VPGARCDAQDQARAGIARAAGAVDPPPRSGEVEPTAGAVQLDGYLTVPEDAPGMWSLSTAAAAACTAPRNRYVAAVLNDAGLGTLLFDLLVPIVWWRSLADGMQGCWDERDGEGSASRGSPLRGARAIRCPAPAHLPFPSFLLYPWHDRPARPPTGPGRDPVGAAGLAPFAERQVVPGVDRAQRRAPDVREHQPLDPVLAGLPGDIQRRHVSPGAPRAKRIGRFQPAASANIRSAPAAQAGNCQNSGAHTADAAGRRSR